MDISFKPSDPKFVDLFLEYRNDEMTQAFNPIAQQSHEELITRLVESCSDWSRFENESSFLWFVHLNQNAVGTASIQNINRSMLTAEIGYGVFKKFRGQGIATQVIRKLTNDTFMFTKIRKLIAFVHEENLPSRQALEKNGYVQEGLLRKHYLINGIPTNEAVYGILREEVQRIS